jgi:hypothetical protein
MIRLRCLALGLLLIPAAVWAGPPYVTDDPEPTELHHWEIYGFGTASRAGGATSGSTGFDINYGGAADLQLTATVPLDLESRQPARVGDIELGAKYRLIHQQEDGLLPDVAIFPRLILPSGRHEHGAHKPAMLLPVWLGKDAGPWSLFGGGGYMLHPGRGNRDYWQEGLALTRMIGPRLTLGAEIYHRGADATDAWAYAGVNVGVTWKLTEHWSLLASGGPGVEHAGEGGRYNLYSALLANF